jgi:Bacteriophage head to tail connecting protein
MSASLADHILAHEQELRTARQGWESIWQDLADVCHPRRGTIFPGGSSQYANHSPEREKVSQNFDGTAMRANNVLANGQASRITPMGSRWFSFKPPVALENNRSACAWYARCGEITQQALYRSNFYNRAHEHYLDRGAFGTAATEITSGLGEKGLFFRSYPIGTYSIATNHLDEVDTVYRLCSYTTKQLLEMFPDTVPASIHALAKDPRNMNRAHEVVHAIYPRQQRDHRKVDARNMPWASVHVLKAEKHVLSESGYQEMPVAVSRWQTWGESPYGWSPGFMALPEATQSNFLEKMLDTLAEVAAFPRILYTAGLKGDIDFKPNGLTCWDPGMGEAPKEWLTGANYQIGLDRLERKSHAINEAFFVPLFNAVSNLRSDATAEQVRAIVNESREIFHPIFANLTREFLGVILKRSFSMLMRQGAFPPPPAMVIQQDHMGAFIDDPQLEYNSVMALALEQSQLANFTDVLATLQPIAQVDPSVFDWVNTKAVGQLFARAKGLPESIIRSDEEIDAIQQARAQMAQAQQAQQAAASIKDLGGPEGLQQMQQMAQQ